jgi:hypothetical protein
MLDDDQSQPPPAEFLDSEGHVWRIDLDVAICKQLRKSGCDLLGATDGQAWLKLAADVELLVDVLWICVTDQAAAADIDEVAFAKRLRGGAIGRAVEALEVAWVNFCHPDVRRVRQAALEQTRKAREAGSRMTEAKLLGPEAAALMQKKLDQAATAIDQSFQLETKAPLPLAGAPKARSTGGG